MNLLYDLKFYLSDSELRNEVIILLDGLFYSTFCNGSSQILNLFNKNLFTICIVPYSHNKANVHLLNWQGTWDASFCGELCASVLSRNKIITTIRSIVSSTTIAGADSPSVKLATWAATEYNRSVYLSLTRVPMIIFFDPDYPLEIGKAVTIRDGSDASIFAIRDVVAIL